MRECKKETKKPPSTKAGQTLPGRILGLVYGGFSYTKNTHEAKLGLIELSVSDRQRINVPGSGEVAGIVAGGALLLFSRKQN